MASSAPGTTTMTTTTTTTATISGPNNLATEQPTDSTTIRLRKKKDQKKVAWNQDTVDNEGLGRKTSKCCCIYSKPHKFDESSSDSEQDDCDHCRGHVEKRSNSTKASASSSP